MLGLPCDWGVAEPAVTYHLRHPSLSLRFSGHFPAEPGLADVYWSKGWWRWWWQLDYWSYKSCKAPVESSPPTNQHPVFLQAGCPSCCPSDSDKALNGKISHSMDLLTPSTPGGLSTFSLTINSSWLPWRRVAMPLISPLMPVPRPPSSLLQLNQLNPEWWHSGTGLPALCWKMVVKQVLSLKRWLCCNLCLFVY